MSPHYWVIFSKISSKILVMAFEDKTRILPRNFVNKLPRDTYHGRKYSSSTSVPRPKYS